MVSGPWQQVTVGLTTGVLRARPVRAPPRAWRSGTATRRRAALWRWARDGTVPPGPPKRLPRLPEPAPWTACRAVRLGRAWSLCPSRPYERRAAAGERMAWQHPRLEGHRCQSLNDNNKKLTRCRGPDEAPCATYNRCVPAPSLQFDSCNLQGLDGLWLGGSPCRGSDCQCFCQHDDV
jgi:hypothetical protein